MRKRVGANCIRWKEPQRRVRSLGISRVFWLVLFGRASFRSLNHLSAKACINWQWSFCNYCRMKQMRSGWATSTHTWPSARIIGIHHSPIEKIFPLEAVKIGFLTRRFNTVSIVKMWELETSRPSRAGTSAPTASNLTYVFSVPVAVASVMSIEPSDL